MLFLYQRYEFCLSYMSIKNDNILGVVMQIFIILMEVYVHDHIHLDVGLFFSA